jgi:hypothetical protein
VEGRLLAPLARAYPRHRLSRDGFEAYLADLAGIPAGRLAEAVRRVVRTSEWFPTVAALRRCCAEAQLALPSEQEALGQVDARAAWSRDRDGDPPGLHPLAAAALARVGGLAALRGSGEPSIVRAQLGKAYRELRDRALEDAQTAD